MSSLVRRPRRLRKNATVRKLTAEMKSITDGLVFPLFCAEGDENKPLKSLPKHFAFCENGLLEEIETCLELGLSAFALFPQVSPEKKDWQATEAVNLEGLIPRAVREIKKRFPEVILIADVALDPYNSDGHDGIWNGKTVVNDPTVEILAQMGLVLAQAGCDFVAPSDMMDGRVGAIREVLDQNGLEETGILAYAAKYASAFYGPFRDTLGSAPLQGDKKSYQMDFRNRREALLEAELDFQEGADILMVKPALAYLDVIAELKQNFFVPIAAYQVSGEFAQIVASAERGWLDREKAIIETTTAIRRAGADIIFSYFAKEILEKRLL